MTSPATKRTLAKAMVSLMPRLTDMTLAKFYRICSKFIMDNLDDHLASEVIVNGVQLGARVMQDSQSQIALISTLLADVHQSCWWTPSMIEDNAPAIGPVNHQFIRRLLSQTSFFIRSELSAQGKTPRKESVGRAFARFCIAMHLSRLLPAACYSKHAKSDVHTLVQDATRQNLFENLLPTQYQEAGQIAKKFRSLDGEWVATTIVRNSWRYSGVGNKWILECDAAVRRGPRVAWYAVDPEQV
ncbi:hypothetical protein CERSUDRAFT_100240 [Gelatoporia subvermispora B]|uniref:Uncharacterized protein n=1 Tax=Ceriporiopsis subvermispora (strain B) TaxID=914234 RepID=M2QZZ3_CERS8|nr:hypothetical protein CERSUDRAFT_100240 [Gelatoporia subvermispora B]